MRETIQEVVRKLGKLGFIETIKVIGTDAETKFEAMDENKTVFIKGKFAVAQNNLKGEFGLNSLPLLSGLLNFANYKTEKATFNVKQRNMNGKNVPEEFEFRDENGMGANFRLMNAALVPEQPVVADIKWDVEFVPQKSRITEFASLATLYSQYDEFFSVKTKDGNLIFAIGEEDSPNHRVSMVFEDEVEGEIKSPLLWPIEQFLAIVKNADGNDYHVSITSRGALQVSVETEFATYRYIMPAKRR